MSKLKRLLSHTKLETQDRSLIVTFKNGMVVNIKKGEWITIRGKDVFRLYIDGFKYTCVDSNTNILIDFELDKYIPIDQMVNILKNIGKGVSL